MSAPDPSVPAGTTYDSAAVTYAPGTGAVMAHTDAANRQRVYSYGTGKVGIQVFSHAADTVPALAWTQNFGGGKNADTGFTDANSHTNTVSYTGSPSPYLPAGEVNRNGQVTNLAYDPSSVYGNLASITDPRGVVTTMTYAYPGDFPLGQVSQVQTQDVNGHLLATTTYDYYTAADTSTDGVTGVLNGLIKTVHSPQPGNTDGLSTVDTTYTYDSLGNVIQIITPGPNSTVGTQSTYTTISYAYTGFSFTDGFNGATHAYTQAEALGEPTAVTVSGRSSTGTTTTTANYYEYDGLGNVTATLDAQGDEDDYTYDAFEEPLTHIYPPTTTVTNPPRAYEQYTYQYPGGSLLSDSLYGEGGALFRQTTYAYGHEGELLSEADLLGPLSSYTYDGLYRVSTLADGAGHQTRYVYDGIGNLLQTAYPGYTAALPAAPGTSDTETYAYDYDQNLMTGTDGRGVVTTYARNDPESLITGVSYGGMSGGSLPFGVTAISPVAFQYDTFGRRKQMADGTGTKTYTYDQTDALLSLTTSFTNGPQGQALTYVYNPDGSRVTQNTPAGAYGYSYDGVGRLHAVTFPWGDSERYGYYGNGWLSSALNGVINTTYSYDRRGFLTGLSHNNINPNDSDSNASPPGTSTIGIYSGMAYDAAGNRLTAPLSSEAIGGSFADPSKTQSYQYDARDELIADISMGTYGGGQTGNAPYNETYNWSFAYDLAYNPTQFRGSSIAAFNGDNQLPGSGFGFDGEGNPTAYQGATFSFDPEDRLTGISGPTLSGPFSAAYDGDGLRAMKSGTPPGGSTGVATYFLYGPDGQPVVEEGWNGTTASVTAANGVGAAGWRERYAGGRATYYAHDPGGSVLARVTATDTTNPADSFSFYDGYGNLRGSVLVNTGQGLVQPDPQGFGGEWGYYTDVETGNGTSAPGLLCLTHRYYDPGTGRFVTRDPAGYGGGVNLYGFAGNNPVNETDPSGLVPFHPLPPGYHATPGFPLPIDLSAVYKGLYTGDADASDQVYQGSLDQASATLGFEGRTMLRLNKKTAVLAASAFGISTMPSWSAPHIVAGAEANSSRVGARASSTIIRRLSIKSGDRFGMRSVLTRALHQEAIITKRLAVRRLGTVAAVRFGVVGISWYEAGLSIYTGYKAMQQPMV